MLVEHFSDGVDPLGAAEKRAIAEAPDIDAELMKEFSVGSTEDPSRRLVESITRPSLNNLWDGIELMAALLAM